MATTTKLLDKLLRIAKQTKDIIRTYAVSDENRISRGLVLGLYEKEDSGSEVRLTTCGEKFNRRVDGKLLNLIHENGLTGRLGTSHLFTSLEDEFLNICVVGMGREGIGYNDLEHLDEGMENARIAAGIGARRLLKLNSVSIHLDAMEYPEQVAEGAALGIFKMPDFKKRARKVCQPEVSLELFEWPDLESFKRGLFKADAQNLSRRLTEMPGNKITPTGFAQAAVDTLCPCGLTVEVRNMDWIESNNMTTMLSVSRTSCEPPVFLEMTYCGGPYDEKPVLLVGTGLTYDTGGISLKDPKLMSIYRTVMCGGATVVATMRAMAALHIPINIVGIVPLCENMTSGMSLKYGDILKTTNCKTIAIHDTRYVNVLLAIEAINYGLTTFKPKLVVDIGGYTRSAENAFNSAATAVFSNSHFMWKLMHKAGSLTGDRVWRMPLWKYYSKKVTSFCDVDISNRGSGRGETCLTAAVLREFCSCVDWLHLDIRGSGTSTTHNIPYYSDHTVTGRPTRTVIQFLTQVACPEMLKN